jgi:hypothetical protein
LLYDIGVLLYDIGVLLYDIGVLLYDIGVLLYDIGVLLYDRHIFNSAFLSDYYYLYLFLGILHPILIWILAYLSVGAQLGHLKAALGMERFFLNRLSAEGLWGGLLYWGPWKRC